MSKRFIYSLLIGLGLLMTACGGAAPAQSTPNTITTLYVTEIVYLGGSEVLREVYYTTKKVDCSMIPSGAIKCDSLGGVSLVHEIGTGQLVATPDIGEFNCNSCAIKENQEETHVWEIDGQMLPQHEYDRYLELTK